MQGAELRKGRDGNEASGGAVVILAKKMKGFFLGKDRKDNREHRER